MTSSMPEGQIRTILGEWVQASLKAGNGDFSVADAERELRAMPRDAGWALSGDARTLWVLGADDALRKVKTTDSGEVESTLVMPLRGETIHVRRAEQPPTNYGDTETARQSAWSFAYINGEEFVTLVGMVFTDRLSGKQRRDQAAILAEAMVALVERNAAH
jgi:hypothetical protein